ncbi:MAG: DUF5655 domain-containing protein [Bacteroidota bacterium]
MWQCSVCNRLFKTTNQSHVCTTKTLDDLFEGKPDNLILAFDKILVTVMDWEPNSVGASKNAVVFTNRKAWLIVKPMSKELDVKFYNDEVIQSPVLKKTSPWGKNKFGHHIRIREAYEINEEVVRLLRIGFDYALI